MIDFDKIIEKQFEGEHIVEFTKDMVDKVPKEFQEGLDNYLTMTTGADSSIVWAMNGRIFIEMIQADNGEFDYRMAGAGIPPGYNEEHHLYAVNSRIYVEDDYAWAPLPDFSDDGYARTVYSDVDLGDEEAFDDEGEVLSSNGKPLPGLAKEADGSAKNGSFMLNFEPDIWDFGDDIKLEPLVVNNFDLDNPVLKVEIAYRNALCEIESYPTCGWITLMHNGHFYVPVESVDDPVNHEMYYYYKVFNSYPTSVTSTRIRSIVMLELFNISFELAVRYRPGYCINWRKYFKDQLLPDNYVDQIPDLYSLSDKPYGTETKNGHLNYDGIECDLHEDGDIEEDDDNPSKNRE